MRLEFPHHVASAIADKYASAFEEWDREMSRSPLRALRDYALDEDRREWLKTMWEMPDKVGSQVANSGMYLHSNLDIGDGQGTLDVTWEGEPL